MKQDLTVDDSEPDVKAETTKELLEHSVRSAITVRFFETL